jgi:putative ABC transport system permease protein
MRTPGVALALLFTIALGIGSNVSIHGFAQGLTGPQAAVSSIDRVVSVFGRDAHREAGPLSYQEYLALKTRRDTFEWIGAARISRSAVEWAGLSETVSVAALTPDVARLLGLTLDGGVVVSQRMWRSESGAAAGVHGNPIHIDGADTHVNGVAPNSLEGVYRDRAIDIWMPLREEGLLGVDLSGRGFWVLGRLRRGVSAVQAQSAVRGNRSGEVQILPYTGMTPEMSAGLSRVGMLFGLAAGAVFFVACANVACFLLGRAFARSREISVRVAVGASRGQLAGESLSDSIVISIAGGALGVLLAGWTSRAIPALLFEQDAERLLFAPDLFGIVAASAACVGVTIGCGLLPVIAIPHDRPAMVLRRESAGPSRAVRRLRTSLVVAQMASCCVLVICTATLFDGLRTALQTTAGHRLGHVILATVQARPDVGVDTGYFERVERAAGSMAGVSVMAWAARLPGSRPTWQSFRVDPAQLPLREATMDMAWFTPDSFQFFAPWPTAGRMFGVADRNCRVAIVNEEAAAELFGRYTVGRTIRDFSGLPVEIIGVVARLKVDTAARENRPSIYYDYTDRKASSPDGIPRAHFRAPVASELAAAELDANVVSPGYFDAMGVSVIAGQAFSHPMQGDCRMGVVNQEAADLYFGGKAVGAAVIDDLGRRTGIVGVVHSAPLGPFQRHVEPAIYFPMSQDALPTMTLIIAGAREVNAPVLADLHRRIESVAGGGLAPVVLQTLETHLAHTALAPLRIATLIIGASAATALVLSVLGLFGALSDAARQRRRELAVRIALGAQRWRVVCQVLGQGARLACAGTLAGTVGSLLLSRLLGGITSASGSPALWVWLAAPLVLAGMVAIASVLPARRALVVNPLMIMRDDS